MRAGLRGQKKNAGRSEIKILCFQIRLIERREKISRRERAGGGKFHDAVAVIRAAGVGVESSVAGGDVKISVRVRRKPAARLPDSAAVSIWRVIPNFYL